MIEQSGKILSPTEKMLLCRVVLFTQMIAHILKNSFKRIFCRMKEQLIRQLVKNEKDSAILVKQHKDKISMMEEVSKVFYNYEFLICVRCKSAHFLSVLCQ